VIPVVATIFGAAYAVQPAYGIGFAKEVYLDPRRREYPGRTYYSVCRRTIRQNRP
jgi:hypothetical protein